ncbi:hypothetical protein [Sphingobium sp. AP50]|nr:hypothetical protein [Sphingobium sp. AP50]
MSEVAPQPCGVPEDMAQPTIFSPDREGAIGIDFSKYEESLRR